MELNRVKHGIYDTLKRICCTCTTVCMYVCIQKYTIYIYIYTYYNILFAYTHTHTSTHTHTHKHVHMLASFDSSTWLKHGRPLGPLKTRKGKNASQRIKLRDVAVEALRLSKKPYTNHTTLNPKHLCGALAAEDLREVRLGCHSLIYIRDCKGC